MKEKSRLLRKVIRLQRERKIIPPNSKLLIAFSGGIDSVVLTNAILELKGFLKIERITLAHFNHRLRDSAGRDEEFCKEQAKSLGLEIFIGSEEVGRIAKEKRANLEETARELRYSFLRKIKEKEGFDLIATAHHLTDLLETVILWLLRGSGVEGLLGFSPAEGDVVRPLFPVTRKEIEDYARVMNLKWVEDPTNSDPSFVRNRIRQRIIPVLRGINPSVEESFYRLWRIIEMEHDFLQREEEKLKEVSVSGECLEVSKIRGHHPALISRVISDAFSIKSFAKIQQVLRLLERGGEVPIGEGRKVVRKGSLLCLKKDK